MTTKPKKRPPKRDLRIGKLQTSSIYASKLLFNITAEDLGRVTEERSELGISQSEYIRRALRFFNAHCRLERIKREFEQAEAEQAGSNQAGNE